MRQTTFEKEIIDYQVLMEVQLNTFNEKAKNMVKQGWIPQGSINITVVNLAPYFSQAFIKTQILECTPID